MARTHEPGRQSPNFLPAWRELSCPSWAPGKLPHEMLALDRRRKLHEKKMVEMEFVILQRRQDVFNLREQQRIATTKDLDYKLKGKELKRAAAEEEAERRAMSARHEVLAVKLPGTWHDSIAYPVAYAPKRRAQPFGSGRSLLPPIR
uniref:Uncharacterized protein n=1 Tax=Prymnesium polylepis TaxID=72548 RepID=A0A6T7Y7X0_9EUKA|mmetsp:Transcript_20849/g.51292  ORF Transcript_20849/g.51292 Transcript_20849/m.51292 type:complete len:147 (+) Transcript_20849:108-548(+)|eukprot:1406158-Prymnesium_polylepis.2